MKSLKLVRILIAVVGLRDLALVLAPSAYRTGTGAARTAL